jgi:elongation factor Ts
MAQVNMQQVKELRERTQAGLNDCRTALMEADGDMEKAVEIILKKGLAKSAKRAGSIATEGVVSAAVAADGRSAVVVEVNIQTDFAARNSDFIAFVDRVVTAASTAQTGADLGAEREPGGPGTLEEARQALVGKLGENITVRRWARVAVDGPGQVVSYVHLGGKIGVLVAASTADAAAAQNPALGEFLDNTAMHVAAMAPQFLATSEVADEAKQKQTDIFAAQLAEEGKPEAVRPKIIQGKLAKWMREVCLLEQESVVQAEQTIEQLRAALSKTLGSEVKLVRFVRFERGEGIDKPKGPDFAEEAKRMAAGA